MPPSTGYVFDNQSGNTLAPGSVNVAAGQPGSYAYQPNGSGGLNYFGGNNAITNAQYAQGTGQDTNALEATAKSNFDNGQVLAANNAANAMTAANDSAINSAVGHLAPQQDIGNQNIMSHYNNAFTTLLNGKNAALGNLGTNRTQTQQGNIDARNNIDQSVGQQSQGLQRLLGAHGSGNSSAAQFLAPWAAGNIGNNQRAQVQTAYGQNMNAIDQGITNTNNQYDTSFGDLANQRDQQKQTLQQGIINSRASLLGQRSDSVNNQGQIQTLLDQATQLGLNPNFTPKSVAYQAPNLQQYNYDTQGISSSDPSTAMQQSTGPYYNLINPQDKQKLAGATVGA